jgi:hypothetical protein
LLTGKLSQGPESKAGDPTRFDFANTPLWAVFMDRFNHVRECDYPGTEERSGLLN